MDRTIRDIKEKIKSKEDEEEIVNSQGEIGLGCQPKRRRQSEEKSGEDAKKGGDEEGATAGGDEEAELFFRSSSSLLPSRVDHGRVRRREQR